MEIRAEHVSVRIGKKEIIDDITAKVDRKEFVGIIGPNGSGKSTFLKTIYRVLTPEKGTIWLGDRELNQISGRQSAKQLGVMTQSSIMNFEFTVEEVVLMGRTPHKKLMEMDGKEDYDIAHDALKKVGMFDRRDSSFNTLSGGEKQRVLIARALTQQPQALILDEPTNHLDIQYQLHLLETVKRLGIEVFAAMHDMNLAAAYCDRLYVIHHGRIVAYGTVKEVMTEKMLKDVFSVRARITTDEQTGKMSILFLGL